MLRDNSINSRVASWQSMVLMWSLAVLQSLVSGWQRARPVASWEVGARQAELSKLPKLHVQIYKAVLDPAANGKSDFTISLGFYWDNETS